MRRMLMMIMCVLLVCFFVGCVKDGNEPSENGPEDTNNIQATQGADGSMEDTATKHSNDATKPPLDLSQIAPTGPETPGNILIDYDPDREIYIACGKTDITFNNITKSTSSWIIPVITNKPLDKEQMQVELDTDYQYDLLVWELKTEDLWQTEYMVQGSVGELIGTETFCYYLYQCYRGTDFLGIQAKIEEVEQAQEDYVKDPSFVNQVVLSNLQSELESLQNAELEAFCALTPEQLPQFYVYGFTLNFLDPVTEKKVITEARFTIEGETYIEPVNIALEAEPPKTNYPYATGIYSYGAIGYRPSLYSQGFVMDIPFQFTANKDMIIKDLYILRDLGAIKEIHVLLTSGEISIDFVFVN